MTIKSERTNIKHPMWRKKIDNSILNSGNTHVPRWVCKMWNFDQAFKGVRGRKCSDGRVPVSFKGHTFEGHITFTQPTSSKNKKYRLSFEDALLTRLRDTFLMSCMREIEGRLQTSKTPIEDEIPFWEFLDIEFDYTNKEFIFTAHYTHDATFPELFKRLTYSPALKRIQDELANKGEFRIHKQGWRPREEFESEIGAENVIYYLADTESKLLYIGEAKRLVHRFRQGHPSIKNWDKYRYNQLPPLPKKDRVTIERMAIRDFSSILANDGGINGLELSKWRLVNKKIDR